MEIARVNVCNCFEGFQSAEYRRVRMIIAKVYVEHLWIKRFARFCLSMIHKSKLLNLVQFAGIVTPSKQTDDTFFEKLTTHVLVLSVSLMSAAGFLN